MADRFFVLMLASAPLPGIIAAVSTTIALLAGNIIETHQHLSGSDASSETPPSLGRLIWLRQP